MLKQMKRFYVYILLSIFITYFNPIVAEAAGPTAVPTFECLGLYWSPVDGSANKECRVIYRIVGSLTWKSAMPLWFDERNEEYRGSIVNLTPDTTYEIELSLRETSTSASFTATTWSETFPIAQTICLPKRLNSTLEIGESGTASGYILYTSQEGRTSTIDVNNAQDICIDIQSNVSYVIIRGLVLKGAKKHGIRLNRGVHDIVIEGCNISGWGTNESDGGGVNYQSAVFAGHKTGVERIIVQRNKMHHPRSDANSWAEYRVLHKSYHPGGPQAVAFANSKGNHVIRYNEVYSDDDHCFNDGLGYGSNYSFKGFPNRDSDIYGNLISNCWDDGIESEGANRNVRIWGNYIDKSFVMIAIASTSIGPLFVWRNVANTSRKNAIESNSNKYGRGPFIKAGGRTRNGTWYGSGRTYVFHNTVLQPSPPQGKTYPLSWTSRIIGIIYSLGRSLGIIDKIYPIGCSGGIISSGGTLYEVISRNNIFTNYKNGRTTFRDNTNRCTNDFDFDLYTGRIGNNCSSKPHQSNGINGQPKFDPDNGLREYALMPGTPGFDAGVIIPNFNDNYHGSGPDMGAIEANSPPMEFGVNTIRRLHRLHGLDNSER